MTEQANPIVEGTESGRWKHPLETLEHPVPGWTLTALVRLWGVGVNVYWSATLMHLTTGTEVTATNSVLDLALSDACAEANRAKIAEKTDAE